MLKPKWCITPQRKCRPFQTAVTLNSDGKYHMFWTNLIWKLMQAKMSNDKEGQNWLIDY